MGRAIIFIVLMRSIIAGWRSSSTDSLISAGMEAGVRLSFRRRIVRHWHPLGLSGNRAFGKPPQGYVIDIHRRVRYVRALGSVPHVHNTYVRSQHCGGTVVEALP